MLAGAGLVGAAGFVGFGVSARNARADLQASCAPNCAESEVDAVRRDLVLANIGLGLAVAGLASAAVVVVLGQGDANKTTAAFGPTRTGFSAALLRRF